MRLGLQLNENRSYLDEIREYLSFILVNDYRSVPYYRQGIDTLMGLDKTDAVNLISSRIKDCLSVGNYSFVSLSKSELTGNKMTFTFTVNGQDLDISILI